MINLRKLLFFAFLAAYLTAQDPDRLKFDNDQVRVLKVTSPPHVKSAMHQHRVNRVMVYLDDGQMTLTDPSGKAQHFRWKAGHVKWDPAGGQHVSENVGDKPFTVVEIEVKKPGPKTAVQFSALDPVKADPKHYKVEFDNDQVRVVRANYGPREKGALHEHALDRIVIFLTDQHMKVTGADGNVQQAESKAGDVVLAGVTKHTEENLSDKPFEVVVVELK